MNDRSLRGGCLLLMLTTFVAGMATPCSGSEPDKQNAEFLNSLAELDSEVLSKNWTHTVGLTANVLSVSKPRSFRPKVSRFRGWYFDSDGTHAGKSDDAQVESVILAQSAAASSWWRLIKTEKGYLIVALGGEQNGRVLSVDETAKARPEGPDLTVSACLRLSNRITPTSFWKITLTENGVVFFCTAGKYKGWCWDFGGGAKTTKEGSREVAHNVLLAEDVVAGSYYDVESQDE